MTDREKEPEITAILKVELSDLKKANRLLKKIRKNLDRATRDVELIVDVLEQFDRYSALVPERIGKEQSHDRDQDPHWQD